MAREPSSTPSTTSEGPSFFADMLSASDAVPRTRYDVGAPLGLFAHALALAILMGASLWSVQDSLSPNLPSATVLQFAPPPPPPLRRGVVERGASPETPTLNPQVPTLVPATFIEIPDDVLAPVIDEPDEPAGVEHGFDDGRVDGLAGGIPGGVAGGVPGGLVGGVIGGTGTALPKFENPDRGPRPIRMPSPSYTEKAVREKIRGSVKLRVIIDVQGKVKVHKILASIPELDAEAIRTVESSWRFEPATKNGRPIPCLSDLVVRFNLY